VFRIPVSSEIISDTTLFDSRVSDTTLFDIRGLRGPSVHE
jgi:hypothetical protein